MWFISISGIFIANEKAFAKELPTNKEPSKPGPLVKATADISFLLIFACLMASSTTGTMFC